MLAIRSLAVALALLAGAPALGQTPGTLSPSQLPALADPNDPKLPAKELFGRQSAPAPLAARAIGFYSRGCLAGARALAVDGETWQVMRLSRNRNWGHPDLIALVENLARRVPEINGWPGLLVGDISQPRGGPMLTGHASHQVGLDADIWLTPMPDRRLTLEEREFMSATNVVAANGLDVDPAAWTPAHHALLRAAAKEPAVERIFVNAAIKKALCREARGDRGWLAKVRPMWGHNYHFHIRAACPHGEEGCRAQDPPPSDEGCGKALDWWFTEEALDPKPGRPAPPVTMAQLPPECGRVLTAR